MNPSEELVKEHLHYRGFVDVIYEPDGNIPPDFLVNGSIAIEVRRLNQNYLGDPQPEGLEQVAFRLREKVKMLLSKMGPPVNSESWFVHLKYQRPVEDWRSLKPKLRDGLKSFAASTMKDGGVVAKGSNFELEVFGPTTKPHADLFVLAGWDDKDSGGWVLVEMEKNIRHCVSEKEKKISKVRLKYAEWWLALVDHIGYALDEDDREALRDQFAMVHTWDRILIIDPRNHDRWFEL